MKLARCQRNKLMNYQEIYAPEYDNQIKKHAQNNCHPGRYVSGWVVVEWEDGTVQAKVTESPETAGEMSETYFLDLPIN